MTCKTKNNLQVYGQISLIIFNFGDEHDDLRC